MTKAERLKALVRERRFKGEISKAQADEDLAEIEAAYQAANPPPPATPTPPIDHDDRFKSLRNVVSGGPDPESVDGNGPFETATEVVFGLDDTFELLGELGSGGFGKVFQARHRLLGQMRAVKRLRPQPGQTAEQAAAGRSRFLFDARALTALEHPGIVRLFDCGDDRHGLFLVMEYVDGPTLQYALDDRQMYSLEESLKRSDHRVTVIGHDDPATELITLAVEVMESVSQVVGPASLFEVARAVTLIEPAIGAANDLTSMLFPVLFGTRLGMRVFSLSS